MLAATMYPPQGYPPYPQQPQPPRGPDPIASVATRALILSAVAVPLCCAPVGIAGIVFGAQAMKMAKERGAPSPGRAVAAVMLGVLSIVVMSATIVAYQIDQKHRAERIAAADEKTKGKLEDDKLEKSVACALVEKQLLEGIYQGTQQVDDVKCGKWESDEKFGTMSGIDANVIGDKKTLTACFARARRWFVLSVVEPGEPCPKDELEVKKGKATEQEMKAEEDELRKDAKKRADKTLVDGFENELIAIRKAMVDVEHEATKCDKLEKASGKVVVSTVDFEYLKDTHTTKDDWSFLTSDRVKGALDDGKPIEDRAKLVREVLADSPTYVIVYAADARDWPETIKPKGFLSKKGFAAGGLDGWMVVVDRKKAKVVCEGTLTFENSKSVSVGKYAGDKGVADALKADLKKNYETAASKKLREMTDGKLRLGFSPLD